MDRTLLIKKIAISTLVVAGVAPLFHPKVRQALGFTGFIGNYVHAYHSVQEKAEELRTAVEDNQTLKLENANLRVRMESLEFDLAEKNAETQTREGLVKRQIAPEDRIVLKALKSVDFTPPAHLLPENMSVLAMGYFRSNEFDKAAVTLTHLVSIEEAPEYRTPTHLLMTGIAWYKVGEYAVADEFFSRLLKIRESENNDSTFAQARLWRALTAQRVGASKRAQFWLTELAEHHPHSTETAWVNELGALPEHREPASEGHGGNSESEKHEAAPEAEHPAQAAHGEHAETENHGGDHEPGHHP